MLDNVFYENDKYSNLYREEKRHKLKDVLPVDTPFGLFVDPSSVCNFRCSFCPHSMKEFAQISMMDYDLFRKIIDDIKEFRNRIKLLRLYCLGEPFINPNFCKMLNLAMEERIAEKIEIATNASLLKKSLVDEILNIAKKHPDTYLSFKFSIYSMYANIHREITHSSVYVENILTNVKLFRKLRDDMCVSNVCLYAKMIEPNDDERDLFIKQYKNVVDVIGVEKLHYWSGHLAENGEMDSHGFSMNRCLQNKKVCAFPFHTMVIHADGAVVCCCVDYKREILIGNVRDESLVNIWNGEKLRNIRLLQLKEGRDKISLCAKCDYISYAKDPVYDDLDKYAPELYDRYL